MRVRVIALSESWASIVESKVRVRSTRACARQSRAYRKVFTTRAHANVRVLETDRESLQMSPNLAVAPDSNRPRRFAANFPRKQ